MSNDVEVRVRTYEGMDHARSYGPDIRLESVHGGLVRMTILSSKFNGHVEVVIDDLIDALQRCKP